MRVLQAPHIDGPFWAQLLVTLIFGLAALGVAYKGYFKSGNSKAVNAAEPHSTAILAASITDGFAMRTLNDSVVRLDSNIDRLVAVLDDLTHHERNGVDVGREVCQRLRELCEELQRQGEDARRRDKRDEKRR